MWHGLVGIGLMILRHLFDWITFVEINLPEETRENVFFGKVKKSRDDGCIPHEMAADWTEWVRLSLSPFPPTQE